MEAEVPPTFSRCRRHLLVLTHVAPSAPVIAPLFLQVSGDHGNIMLVRRHGSPTAGCIVFFPANMAS